VTAGGFVATALTGALAVGVFAAAVPLEVELVVVLEEVEPPPEVRPVPVGATGACPQLLAGLGSDVEPAPSSSDPPPVPDVPLPGEPAAGGAVVPGVPVAAPGWFEPALPIEIPTSRGPAPPCGAPAPVLSLRSPPWLAPGAEGVDGRTVTAGAPLEAVPAAPRGVSAPGPAGASAAGRSRPSPGRPGIAGSGAPVKATWLTRNRERAAKAERTAMAASLVRSRKSGFLKKDTKGALPLHRLRACA
jgi:hypothetical protein